MGDGAEVLDMHGAAAHLSPRDSADITPRMRDSWPLGDTFRELHYNIHLLFFQHKFKWHHFPLKRKSHKYSISNCREDTVNSLHLGNSQGSGDRELVETK